MAMLSSKRWQTTNQVKEERVYPSSAQAQQFKKGFTPKASYGGPSPVKAPSMNSHWNMRGNASQCLQSPTKPVGRGKQFNQWATSSSSFGSQVAKSPTRKQNNFEDAQLCFEAYFSEAVHESMFQERQRVRKCIVRFFLADDTMEIIERKTENSGISGGKFLRRMQVGKPRVGKTELEPYLSADLFIGGVLHVNSHDFTLVECANDFTKSWYAQSEHAPMHEEEAFEDEFSGYLTNAKQQTAETIAMPTDEYQEHRIRGGLERPKAGADEVVNFGHRPSALNQYVECSLGNTMYGVNSRPARPGFNQPQMAQGRGASTKLY
jgi:hypothetical protein